jgi:lipopolysaccharide export system permease protein
MMRTLDLYLTRRFLLCLGLAVISLLLIAIVIDLTENIDTFIDFEARPGQILRYYVYRVPYWLILTLPIAALLGSLFAMTSLARQNEIAAMKAAGISLYRLLAPVLLCACAVSILAFLFTDLIVPDATYRYNQISDQIKSYHRNDGSRRQVLLQDTGEQLVYARSYDALHQRADEVSWERLMDNKPLERIVARRMEWSGNSWNLLNGRRFRFAEDGSIATTSFDTLALTSLSLRPIDFTRQQKATEEMDYTELADHIERTTLNGEDATRHRVDLHLKVAFPLTSFIIIALGATLGANARRTGLANSFGLGVLLCFAYYSCVKAGQALGWNQLLAPWLGAWIANLLFAGLALVLLWRAHK